MQGPSKMFSSALAKLVSDGTITSAQKTAISPIPLSGLPEPPAIETNT